MARAVGGPKIHSKWSSSAGILSFYRDNASTQLAFGENDTGLDVKFYGDTASAYMLWDESADTLVGASGATLDWDGPVALAGTVSCAAAAAFTSSVAFAGPAAFTGSTTTIGNASTDNVGFFGATATIQITNVALATCSATPSTAIAAVVNGLVAVGLMTPSA